MDENFCPLIRVDGETIISTFEGEEEVEETYFVDYNDTTTYPPADANVVGDGWFIPDSCEIDYMWGIEPLRLSATFTKDDFGGPLIGVEYRGKNIDYTGTVGSEDVQSYAGFKIINSQRTVVESYGEHTVISYSITGYNDVYYWGNKKITVTSDDPELGVPISTIAEMISSETGWTFNAEMHEIFFGDENGENDVRVPYINFTGTITEAIKYLENCLGLTAYLDHFNRQIRFTDNPVFETPSGSLYEKMDSDVTTQKVVVFGNLNKQACDNYSAAEDLGISSYTYFDTSIPAGMWEVSPDVKMESFMDIVLSEGSWEEVDSVDYNGNVSKTYIRTETHSRTFAPVVTCMTDAIRQDEVRADYTAVGSLIETDGDPVALGDEESSNRLEVEFKPPSAMDEEYAKMIIDKIHMDKIVTQTYAMTLANDYMQLLLNRDFEAMVNTNENNPDFAYNMYIIPYQVDPSQVTLESNFSLNAVVIAQLPVESMTYNVVYKKTSLNGDEDPEIISQEAPVSKLNLQLISKFFQTNVLRHLQFRWYIEGQRIVFPYAVDSNGNIYEFYGGEESEEAQEYINKEENTLFVQNNTTPDLALAIRHAYSLYTLLQNSKVRAYINSDFNLWYSRYTESFRGNSTRVLAYTRES